jgi:hypothetical protein
MSISAGETTDILNATLTFRLSNGVEKSLTAHFQVPRTPADDGPKLMAENIFAEIQKDLWLGAHFDMLENCEDLSEHPFRTYTFEQQISGEHLFLENTSEVWREITNDLLETRYLLAESRALKDVELSLINKGEPEVSNRVLSVHLNKMDAFDRAIYLLARIEDLLLLLLFVNLGNSLVETDLTRSDWQKDVTWRPIKEGLKRRGKNTYDNAYLNALSDEDYNKLIEVVRKFKGINEVQEITNYRDKTTHRIHPSVDYHGFGAHLVFPRVMQQGQTVRMMVPSSSKTTEFQFLDLYSNASKVFGHYVNLLRELKSIPRFA